MLACVPETLKQKFEYLPDYDRQLEFNTFNSPCEIKYLTQNDTLTSFLACYLHHEVVVYKAPVCKYYAHFLLPRGAVIKDVEYLPDEDLKFRLVVAVHTYEKPHNYIALLEKNKHELVLIRKVTISHKITCMRVILTDYDVMKGKSLSTKLMEGWPNVIAIGTEDAHCYLTYMRADEESSAPVPILDPLLPLHQNCQLTYTYLRNKMECKTEYLNIDECSLTAFGYLNQCDSLVIGFRFGGLMILTFEEKMRMICLRYLCPTPVSHIVYLEPHDDPKNTVYFCVGYPENEHEENPAVQMVLYSRIEANKYSKRVFLKLTHKFPKGKKWLSMRTLCFRNDGDGNNDSNNENESPNSRDIDRSLLFMAYITQENKLMGSLFDLNAFYYSRLVPKVKPDKTIACQNPFLSYIWPSDVGHFDLKELVVDGETIYRSMVNMNYSDQLYYPSNYEIPCIYGFSCSKVYNFRVPSIKTQVLQRIGKHLHVCVKSPYRAAECFCALGLSTDYDMDPFDVVFSCLILYEHTGLIIKFISTLQKQDEMISKIHSCVRNVAESARSKMDSTRPLCSRGQREFDDAMGIFEASINILDQLISVANDIPNDTLVQDLEVTRDSSKAYVQYYLCVKSLIHRGMLPLSDKTENIFQRMREETSCRRREIGAPLNIDKLAVKVSSTKLSENETHQELYPPTIAALIAPLLSLELPINVKKEWIVYNFIDYFLTEGNLNKQNRSKKAIHDYIEGTVGSYFEIKPNDIQNVYDAWSGDHSCLTQNMETTKDLNISLVSNQSSELLDMTDTFLKELIMSDKPKRKAITEITYRTSSLKQMLLRDQELKSGLVGDTDVEDILNSTTLQGGELDETASWQQLCSHMLKSRLKNLGFDQSDAECSPEVKMKVETLDQDPEYKDRIGKLINFRTYLNDSVDSNSSLEESLSTQDSIYCSCNKDTSLYKCCDNSSRMRASLATQEAEFMSGLELAKTIISDGFYCFQKFCDKMQEKKNKKGESNSSLLNSKPHGTKKTKRVTIM